MDVLVDFASGMLNFLINTLELDSNSEKEEQSIRGTAQTSYRSFMMARLKPLPVLLMRISII